MAFVAAGNILLQYLVSCAAVARSWTSYFATLCNLAHGLFPDNFRILAHGLAENYNLLDPIAVGILIVIGVLACCSTKGSSRLNYVASIVKILVIVFIIIAGLFKADTKNYEDFAPYGPRGIFQASAVVFFVYVGFDAVSTMAEETKNPRKDIPVGLMGSMVITTIVYFLLAMTLTLMQNYTTIDRDAPYYVSFQAVGMDWAKYLVAAGALTSIFITLFILFLEKFRSWIMILLVFSL